MFVFWRGINLRSPHNHPPTQFDSIQFARLRCVVSRKGEAVDMSTDHKPEDDVELARIEKAGGAVVDGRVQVRAGPASP